MSLINHSDADFRVCQINLSTLMRLQVHAEERGWSTRWSSVDALLSQVKDGGVILQSFMRQEQAGGERKYRCLVLFETLDALAAGGVTTLDVSPTSLTSLPRLDSDPEVSRVFLQMFALALGGIELVSKE